MTAARVVLDYVNQIRVKGLISIFLRGTDDTILEDAPFHDLEEIQPILERNIKIKMRDNRKTTHLRFRCDNVQREYPFLWLLASLKCFYVILFA